MIDQQQLKTELFLKEYEIVKAEQTARVGFRDNLLYVTLTLFGGILAYAISETNSIALLVLPWVCLIMGWTYLVNDEKISALGRYVRDKLSNGLAKELGIHENTDEMAWIFGWETEHRSDKYRKRRKIEQLIIDEITFVLSGIGALIGFQFMAINPSCWLQILCGFELILLLILGAEIVIYADLAEGNEIGN
jgi:hypothetical protein